MDENRLYRELGEISSELKEASRQRAAMFTSIDTLTKSVNEHNGQILLLNAAVTNHLKEDVEHHTAFEKRIDTEIMPEINDFRTKKNRITGFILGVSAASGSVGAAIASIFNKGN